MRVAVSETPKKSLIKSPKKSPQIIQPSSKKSSDQKFRTQKRPPHPSVTNIAHLVLCWGHTHTPFPLKETLIENQ